MGAREGGKGIPLLKVTVCGKGWGRGEDIPLLKLPVGARPRVGGCITVNSECVCMCVCV